MDNPHAHHSHGTAVSHDKHAGHHAEDFLRKFWLTLALTVPLILLSDLPEAFLGWSVPHSSMTKYAEAFLGSVVFFYGGLVFLRGAWRELTARMPGMMTLIALAITAAYVYSMGVVFTENGMTLFWELSTLVAVMLIGHWVEMKAVTGAQGALRELAKLLPDTAEVVRDGAPVTVPISDLKEGDIVLVRPGGRIPADGVVVSGESDVDESLITGESRPVFKQKGMVVIAGSISGDGSIEIRLEKLGEHTFLAGIMRLVAEAESSKSKLQLLSDRAAFYLTVLAVVAGAITFAAWMSVGASFGFSVERLVAVLVIACPHALGLAIPLVASISTTLASKNGFFVKRRLALEAARNVTTVLFDKTGTLTEGKFGVVAVIGDPVRTLMLAASANVSSEHPLGKAVVAYAETQKATIVKASSFANIRGKGVQVELGGKVVYVGSSVLVMERSAGVPSEFAETVSLHEREGKTVIHVIEEGQWVGAVALADVVRDESRAAIQALKAMGIKVAMITGDAEDVAAWVSKELGIDEYFAHVLPHQKADAVQKLQARGEKVAMVGDGVNDAPALTQADLGIAVGAGTNVAIESAGIILVKNDPRDIPKIIRLSQLTYRKMIENLFWASGYNIIALPVAAGAFAAYGVMLQPAFAAVFMSLSTVIVAFNASLLRRQVL